MQKYPFLRRGNIHDNMSQFILHDVILKEKHTAAPERIKTLIDYNDCVIYLIDASTGELNVMKY